MSRWVMRFASLFLLACLVGCDVAIAAVFLSRQIDDGGNNGPPPTPLPVITVDATDADADEETGGTGTFTFTRTTVLTGDLVVTFTVSGSATPGVDYSAIGTTITIPDSQSTATLTVTPTNDILEEGAETVTVTISVNSAYGVGSPNSATVTISETDDPKYHVWAANLADEAAADAQRAAIQGNGGVPNGPTWTEIATGTSTTIFDFTGGTWNAILVQASNTLVFDFDALERMDAAGNVLENATNPIHSNRVTTPADVQGAADGLAARSNASATEKAFLLTRFASPAPIEKVRVRGWSVIGGRGTSDVQWRSIFTVPGRTLRAAGADVNAAGQIYAAYSDVIGGSRDIKVVQFTTNGVPQDAASVKTVESNVTASISGVPAGSAAIAVRPSSNEVCVASTGGVGRINVRKFSADLVTEVWATGFDSGGVDLVEHNGIAVDGAGDVIVAGGFDFGIPQGVGHYMQKISGGAPPPATMWAGPATGPLDSNATYWRAVAAVGTTDIVTAGDLQPTALGSIDAYARKSANATGGESWATPVGGTDGLADCGNAVGVDSAGNVYVGGFITNSSGGRSAALWKFSSAGVAQGAPYPLLHAGSAGQDDEILDVLVEPDGTVYAAGYETVSNQGENLWVRKYAPNGSVAWTHTYHGSGTGNDRAVSIMSSGGFIVVVGHELLSGGDTAIHAVKIVK